MVYVLSGMHEWGCWHWFSGIYIHTRIHTDLHTYNLFTLCIWVFLHVYICATSIPSDHGGKEEIPEPLDLVLLMVLSPNVGSNWTSARAATTLNHWALSPAVVLLFSVLNAHLLTYVLDVCLFESCLKSLIKLWLCPFWFHVLMNFKLLESICFWGVRFHMHVYACGICSTMGRYITYMEGRGGCWISYSTIFHLIPLR